MIKGIKNTLFSKAGICNNQYSDEVKRLLEIRDIEIRKSSRDHKKLHLILKQLKEEVKKERNQWLEDTLEDRKKEALKKREEIDNRKLQGLFDEYFN